MIITDDVALASRTGETIENFITDHPIYIEGQTVNGYLVKKGEAIIAATSFDESNKVFVRMTFPEMMAVSVEKKVLDDKRMQKSWKQDVYRIQLTVPSDAPLHDTYIFKFTRVYL